MWSIGVRYQGVLNALERYRRLRAATGADPERDTPADLISVIEGLGGPEAFADAVHNGRGPQRLDELCHGSGAVGGGWEGDISRQIEVGGAL